MKTSKLVILMKPTFGSVRFSLCWFGNAIYSESGPCKKQNHIKTRNQLYHIWKFSYAADSQIRFKWSVLYNSMSHNNAGGQVNVGSFNSLFSISNIHKAYGIMSKITYQCKNLMPTVMNSCHKNICVQSSRMSRKSVTTCYWFQTFDFI